MSDTSKIVRVFESDDAGSRQRAGELMRLVLNRGSGHQDVLAVIRSNPVAVLRVLNQGDDVIGMSLRGSADILDEVAESFPDQEAARRSLSDHLSPDRLSELLRARGDLPSSAADLVGLEQLLKAILDDALEGLASGASDDGFDEEDEDDEEEESPPEDGEEEDEPDHGKESWSHSSQASRRADLPRGAAPEVSLRIAVALYGWAFKLKGRSDYAAFLAMEVEDWTVRELIIAAAYCVGVGAKEGEGESLPSLLDAVGLDPDADALHLDEIQARFPEFSSEDIQDVRDSIAQRAASRRDSVARVPSGAKEARDLSKILDF